MASKKENTSGNGAFADGKFTFSGQGEDTVILASNKSSQNKFRAYKATTVSGNPGGYPSEFTLYKLNENGGGDSGDQTVAAPQASPQAGEVEAGTEITLTASTAGATIYFTLDGSDPTDESAAREVYSSDNRPVITESCTLKAAAELNGVYSVVQTLQYTVSESGEEQSPIADGDQVVIWAPAYNKALSGEYSGYYNQGTDVAESGGILSGYTENDIWTVKDNGDGTWSFSYNGQNIAMGDSFSSMPLGEKNDKWLLEDAGNGLYYVKNTVRDAYIEWYASNNNWSAYYSIAPGSEGMFALKFYQVTDTPGVPEEPDQPGSDTEGLEVEASPVSGASVVAGQKITLTAAEGAEIYYTMNTDGTEPADPEAGNEAQKYSAPIEITETPDKDKPIIVKALAYVSADGKRLRKRERSVPLPTKRPCLLTTTVCISDSFMLTPTFPTERERWSRPSSMRPMWRIWISWLSQTTPILSRDRADCLLREPLIWAMRTRRRLTLPGEREERAPEISRPRKAILSVYTDLK